MPAYPILYTCNIDSFLFLNQRLWLPWSKYGYLQRASTRKHTGKRKRALLQLRNRQPATDPLEDLSNRVKKRIKFDSSDIEKVTISFYLIMFPQYHLTVLAASETRRNVYSVPRRCSSRRMLPIGSLSNL